MPILFITANIPLSFPAKFNDTANEMKKKCKNNTLPSI